MKGEISLRYTKQFKSIKDINAREATELVSLASDPSCSTMYLRRVSDPDYRQVNVASILGIMSLNIKRDDELEIACSYEADLTFADKIVNWFTNNSI